jgi:hypothetical protein
MKIGSNKLKMSSGEVRTFKSEEARNNFERVAQAVKHGWKPTGKGQKHHSPPTHEKFSNPDKY